MQIERNKTVPGAVRLGSVPYGTVVEIAGANVPLLILTETLLGPNDDCELIALYTGASRQYSRDTDVVVIHGRFVED